MNEVGQRDHSLTSGRGAQSERRVVKKYVVKNNLNSYFTMMISCSFTIVSRAKRGSDAHTLEVAPSETATSNSDAADTPRDACVCVGVWDATSPSSSSTQHHCVTVGDSSVDRLVRERVKCAVS